MKTFNKRKKMINNQSTPRMKTPVKYLIVAMAASIMTPISQADVKNKQIGDLEIYQAATPGKTTLMLMIDKSGSMDRDGNGGGVWACEMGGYSNVTGFNQNSGTTPNYIRKGCYYKTLQNFDRLTRVKDGLFDLLQGNAAKNITKLSDDIVVGLSFFSATGREGYISVPARALNQSVTNNGVTKTQREWLLQNIADIAGYYGTPTAHAYAEVGAYMMGTNTTNTVQASASGMRYSSADSKSGANYLKPASLLEDNAQCSGQGIYFLTDGNPNSTSYDSSTAVMRASLEDKGSSFSCDGSLLSNINGEDSWDCIYKYSQALLDPSKNPAGRMFKTAVVGFGSDFNTIPSYDKTKTEAENIRSIDGATAQGFVKNAAKWGVYGKGGWYRGSSSEDVVNSITEFLGTIGSTYIAPIPSGTIVVPDDPYRADSQLAIAFYPIVQADVGNNPATWLGNLKKYNLNEGTLYGKANSPLFLDASGALSPTTEDLWSATSVANANNAVTSGGYTNRLPAPTTAPNNVRTLYLEDYTATGTATSATKPKLRKFGVNAAGKVTLDGNPISASNKFNDTATYSDDRVRTLIEFLGFTLTESQKKQAIKDLVLTAAPSAIQIAGATIHSTPSMVSYSATLDKDGKITDQRDDYVLFGSSDGALHLVNADDYKTNGNGGKEEFAFIPKLMLSSQLEALKTKGTGIDVGKPYVGVDAPWLVSATYHYDFDNKQVTVTPCANDNTVLGDRDCEITGIYAYGGLRMGGEGLYGLDLSTRTTPSLMFAKNPTSAGFDRMGQIWAKPTKAKIKTSANDAGTEVLVFGGGYDTCYEDENYQVGTTTSSLNNQRGQACNRTTNTEAIGNAVYIVNAKTGDLIWSASSSATPTPSNRVSTMTNSIVGGITALDRNNDGFMDQLYFADLGGQVFRADFTNAGATQYNTDGSIKLGSDNKPTLTTSFANTRVVRMLQPAFSGANTKFNHRFYERPVVSFYRGDSTFNNGRLFAMVNVISGDRSSPLSKIRSDNTYADRLYGIMDTDVTLEDKILYADDFTTRKESTATNAPKVQKVVDLTADTTATSKLLALPSGTLPLNLTTKKDAITAVKGKQGWYYPLTRFDGYSGVKYTKGVGRSEVINNFLYTTTYNPDMSYGAAAACSAKVTGGSERQLYCLPYGVCLKESKNSSGAATDEYAASKNGTGGFVRAGQGIQELTLGPRSSTLANQRLLIGIQTLTNRALGRVDFGNDSGKHLFGETGSNNTGLDSGSQLGVSKDGDGSAAENIFHERYALKPNTWYEAAK